MMTERRISAVIPAYNCRAYIGRAIESVLAQTRPADEIIVVDDGSTDGTNAEIERYKDRIIHIRQENLGASEARNAGIRRATGDWIAFLDGDDEWLPDKLRKQEDLLERHPELMWVSGNFYRLNEHNSHPVEDMTPEQKINIEKMARDTGYIKDFFVAYAAHAQGHTDVMLIKKDVIAEAGYFTSGLLRRNDLDMWFRIAYRHPQIGFLTEPLAVYNTFVENSTIKKHAHHDHFFDFLDRHLELARKYRREQAFRACASGMLKHQLRQMVFNASPSRTRTALHQYRNLLNAGFRLNIFLRSLHPATTRKVIHYGGKLKELIGLKRRGK